MTDDSLRPPISVRTLRDDTRIIVVSDTHIGGDAGRDIFESPDELASLLGELSEMMEPVELLLAGDFFDFLEIGTTPPGENRASVTVSRPEYRSMFAALRRFAQGQEHRVIYLPGNHDTEMWWNSAIQETLRREGLVHEFARSYAARFDGRPDTLIYCEHGNQFDPANTITDFDDPLDTPFGDHIVTDVIRRIVPGGASRKQFDVELRDINKVYPLVAIPELLASRFFYDLLGQIFRWMVVPLVLAYAMFRAVAWLFSTTSDDPAGSGQRSRSKPRGHRVFVEIGYDASLLLTALVVSYIVIRRLGKRFVSSTAAQLPGLSQSESSTRQIANLLASGEEPPMGSGVTGREIDVFISGHTHAPSLTSLRRPGEGPALVVNSGCWLRQLRPAPARLGGPSVFTSNFVLTHVRLALCPAGVAVALWEHPRRARQRLRMVERLALAGRLPEKPEPNATPRIATEAVLPGRRSNSQDASQ